MLHWVAGLWVYGVGIFLAPFIIEITIVSACGHCLVGDVEHGLQLAALQCRVVHGLCHAYSPRHPVGVDARRDYLAAYLHHEVLYPMTAQQVSHAVGAIALGHA